MITNEKIKDPLGKVNFDMYDALSTFQDLDKSLPKKYDHLGDIQELLVEFVKLIEEEKFVECAHKIGKLEIKIQNWRRELWKIVVDIRKMLGDGTGEQRMSNETIEAKYLPRMRELIDSDDTEMAHSEADDILIDILKELGFTKLIELYEKVGKWYA